MAQATLNEMAREIHLYSGELAPLLQCKRWIRDRYRSVCEKQIWSFKIARSAFGTTDQYSTGTITLTNASASVVGSGTTFTASHVGQQLKVNGFVFTISSFTNTTTIGIDQTWLGATAASNSFQILQAYITPSPTDFHAFYTVIDPTNNWRLRLGFNSHELDRIDARRASAGTPYIVASGVYNSAQVPVFELWPHPTAQKMYPYVYERRVTDLTDNITPPPIIRSDILVKGALADLARWQGTPERKNPYYDPYLVQWKAREAEFKEELNKAIVEDQSILLTDLSYGNDLAYYPIDANFMRSHAF